MRNILKKAVSVLSAAIICVSSFSVSAFADTYKTEKLPDNEAIRFVDSMGAGWNIGNGFDATDCPWVTNKLDFESAWCGAKATKELIKNVKKAGIKTVRVPVSWHDHVDDKFNIDKDWMNRVKEVIDWCIDEGLYVIVDVHHDVKSGYYYPSKAELKSSKKYMTAVWKQIADKFKDYDEKLIFETINEPRLVGTEREWWYPTWDIPAEVKESLECINELNQTVLDTIRKSGGSNKNRYVLVGGYDTDDMEKGILSKYFKMPKDSVKNRLIADVHCYSISEKDYKKRIDGVYSAFVSKGIPAVYTEYGLNEEGYDYKKNLDIAINKISDFTAYARSRGISVVLWDNNYGGAKGFKFIDRATGELTQKKIVQAFVKAGAPAIAKTTASSSSKSALTVKSGKKGAATLTWANVEGATKYAVYKYVNGEYKSVKSSITPSKKSDKQTYTVTGLKSGSTYKFAVKAYVNGKWTKLKKSDAVSVKVK